jgi:hypothetical protein
MATSYPGGLDSYSTKSGAAGLNSPDHAGAHNDLQDAIVAIETELGIDVAGASLDLVARLVAIDAAITLNTAKVTYPTADSTKLAGIETAAMALKPRPQRTKLTRRSVQRSKPRPIPTCSPTRTIRSLTASRQRRRPTSLRLKS